MKQENEIGFQPQGCPVFMPSMAARDQLFYSSGSGINTKKKLKKVVISKIPS